jgi:hypothetical protein
MEANWHLRFATAPSCWCVGVSCVCNQQASCIFVLMKTCFFTPELSLSQKAIEREVDPPYRHTPSIHTSRGYSLNLNYNHHDKNYGTWRVQNILGSSLQENTLNKFQRSSTKTAKRRRTNDCCTSHNSFDLICIAHDPVRSVLHSSSIKQLTQGNCTEASAMQNKSHQPFNQWQSHELYIHCQ